MKIFLLFFCLIAALFAESIDRYDVKIWIKKEGSFHVQEEILYDFGSASRHGIYRDIPYLVPNSIKPIDIGLRNFHIAMDAKNVPYRINKTARFIHIRIGDPNRFVQGKHLYVITYDVQKGVLFAAGHKDIIRWNAIGTGWSVPIHSGAITLHLPEVLSKENVQLHVFTGRFGSHTSKARVEWPDTHTVLIKAFYLAPHEGVTVEIAYPHGLLLQKSQSNREIPTKDILLGYLQWPLLFVFLVLLYRYYLEHSSHIKKSIPVFYKPPEDIDALQAGLIIDRFAQKKDFPAALVWLAVHGYITMKKVEEQGIFGLFSSEVVITKIQKQPTNLSKAMSYLYNGLLFPFKTNTFILKKSNELAKKIEQSFDAINDILYKWAVEERYFHSDIRKERKRFLLIFGALFSTLFVVLLLVASKYVSFETVYPFFHLSVFLLVGLWAIFRKSQILVRFIGVMFVAISLFALFGFLRSIDLHQLLIAPVPFFVVGIVVIWYVFHQIGVYTKKGKDLYIRLMGLKEFIERAEAGRIRYFLQEDERYLDKLLPYAMLFGLTDHWLDIYKELGISSAYGIKATLDDIEELQTTATQASSYSDASSSGGFSGGGGGGSW